MLPSPRIREYPMHHELIENISCSPRDLPDTLGRTYGEIAMWAAQHGVRVSRPFARYTSFTPEACTLEAGYIVDRTVPVKDDRIRAKDDGGYVALSALHVGPYASLGKTHDALKEYIQIHGYAAAGAPVEYYLTPPDTPPDEQRTEVVWPVVPNEM
jgi:effector-binding domain-containing protein